MRIRNPSKRICKRFHLTYELKGAQKGVEILTPSNPLFILSDQILKNPECNNHRNKPFLFRILLSLLTHGCCPLVGWWLRPINEVTRYQITWCPSVSSLTFRRPKNLVMCFHS